MPAMGYSTPQVSRAIVLRSRHYCYTRESMTNPKSKWTFVPYLECISYEDRVAPDMAEAEFIFHFGFIYQHDKTAFAQYNPPKLKNLFVQIRVLKEGDKEPTVYFTGTIPDEQFILHRPDVVTGDQTVRAYSLVHICDRNTIHDAVVMEPDPDLPGEFFPTRIGWCPTFNDRGQWGAPIFGNRSSELIEDDDVEPEDLVYAFGEQNQVWTALDVMRYLLWNNPWKLELKIELWGQYELLESIKQVWNLAGMSYWAAFNQLIRFDYGVGFRVGWDKTNDVLGFEVYSIAEADIGVGKQWIRANKNVVSLTMPTTYPLNHLVDQIPFRLTSLNRYDEFEATSARIKVCGTWVGSEGELAEEEDATPTLEAHWPEALENDYKVPPGVSTSDRSANTTARAKERYSAVYKRFRVPKDWKWVSTNPATDATEIMAPKSPDDGYVTFVSANISVNSLFQKEFFRDTPFEKGKRYDKLGLTDENEPGTQPEYVPCFAFFHDIYRGELHLPSRRWVMLDKASQDNKKLKDCGLKTLDKELGFEVTCTPNHFLGLNHFIPPGGSEIANANATERSDYPEIDYETICFTGMFESDQRVRFAVKTRTKKTSSSNKKRIKEAEFPKKLVIEVPECEFWWASKTCVCGIDEKGQLLTVHPQNKIIRDDRPKLAAVLAFALAWYGEDRQAVEIPIKEVGMFVQLGHLVNDINMAPKNAINVPVKTVVTSRSINFRTGTTVLRTGYQNLDVKTLVGSRWNMKKFAGRKGAATKGVGSK